MSTTIQELLASLNPVKTGPAFKMVTMKLPIALVQAIDETVKASGPGTKKRKVVECALVWGLQEMNSNIAPQRARRTEKVAAVG